MTTRLGVPEALLHERIEQMSITAETALQCVIDLLKQDIASTQAMLSRSQGVGCYQEDCQRWQHHLEAFDRSLDVMDRITQKVQPMFDSKLSTLVDQLSACDSSLGKDAADVIDDLLLQVAEHNLILSGIAERLTEMLDQTPDVTTITTIRNRLQSLERDSPELVQIYAEAGNALPIIWQQGVNVGWDRAIECMLHLLMQTIIPKTMAA